MNKSEQLMREFNQKISEELDSKKAFLSEAVQSNNTSAFLSSGLKHLSWEEKVDFVSALVEETLDETWTKTGNQTWTKDWPLYTGTLVTDSSRIATFTLKEKMSIEEYAELNFGANVHAYHSEKWNSKLKRSELKTTEELKAELEKVKEKLVKEKSLFYQFKEALRVNGVLGKILLFPAFPVFVYYHYNNIKKGYAQGLVGQIEIYETVLSKHTYLEQREKTKAAYHNDLIFEKMNIKTELKSLREALEAKGVYSDIHKVLD